MTKMAAEQATRSGLAPGPGLLCPPLRLYQASGFVARFAGVWRRPLAEHEALWLLPCRAVHTLGLRAPLDIVFLDEAGRILHEAHALAPNRCAWHWPARSVVELPGGYIRRFPGFRPALRAAMAAPAGRM